MSAAPQLGATSALQPGPRRLVAEGLVKVYGKRTVVNGVSFDVQRGEVVGLLGPNGAGKSTSFHMTMGLVRADGGRVLVDSADVTGLPMFRRARLGLGYLPQEASIFRKMTVRDNFLAILEMQSLDRSQRNARADALLGEFGLQHVEHSLGESLSGGERRRAEIARCLIPSPGFILFDEPFAGIDPINVHELQRQIADLKGRGLGVLITDHNVRDTLRICDRAYLIAEGRILEQGTPQYLAASPVARQKYLGEDFKLD